MSEQIRSELVKCGDSFIEALRSGDRGWVVVKQVCGYLGIDFSAQRRRLERQPWAVVAMMAITGSDGKTYDGYCLDSSCAGMWLATIDVLRVKDPAVRDRLSKLQKEAAKVLDAWLRGSAEPALAPARGPLDVFEQMVVAMRATRAGAAAAHGQARHP